MMDNDDLSDLSVGNNGQTEYYDGSDHVSITSREELIANDTITIRIKEHIHDKRPLCFMPIDIYEDNSKDYTLRVYGILMNGSKVEVNLTGLHVFVDVLIPKGVNEHAIQLEISSILNQNDTKIPFWTEIVTAYSLHEFSNEPRQFKRIYTTNTWHRNTIIKLIRNNPDLQLYSNDLSHYYRKVARENKLSLSDWVIIKGYDYEEGNMCEYIFTLPHTNYVKLDSDKLRSNPYVIKDRTMVMAWDIETYSSEKTGEIPVGEKDNDVAFMICLSFHWLHDPNALLRVCIVDKDTENDSRWHTIVCGNHINVIKAMALCWNKMKPDLIIGYNDSGYDWPFVMEKCIKHDLVEWFWKRVSCLGYNQSTDRIIRNYYNGKKERMVKINAERAFASKCLMVPGTIPMDCLPCYMKLYPRLDENKFGSLKFYLKDNLLPTKVDLPIPTLWRYYESGNKTHMRDIAYYCIVDTISVQRLFVKRGVITNYREIATLAYVSLADAHYYADGMKVRNLLGSYAWQANILVNMNPSSSIAEKYPGAYVFPPDRGITPNMNRLNDLLLNPDKEQAIINFAKDRPVSCLDFASLYPNIIITYNLSPEKIILTKEEADTQQCALHPINFTINNRPITAWSVRHGNNESKMGLFPVILKTLFAKRKEMKNLLKVCSDKKEIYDLIFSKTSKDTTNTSDEYIKCISDISESFNNDLRVLESELLNSDSIRIPIGSTLEDELANRNNRISNIKSMLAILTNVNVGTIQNDYNNICFERTCIDKKQNALKIYMNTFYGETGNHRSPFYLLQLAGGVTSAGQKNITLAADYAQSRGFNIKYGDSVMPYTPMTIKIGNNINVITIDSFTGIWTQYEDFKLGDSNRSEKQQIKPLNTYVWTQHGFTRIVRVIRHKTNKTIYRIVTGSSLVDVTEDHSLLDINCNIIKPSDCVVGTELLHSKPNITCNVSDINNMSIGVNLTDVDQYTTAKNIKHSIKDDLITSIKQSGSNEITTVSQLTAQKYYITLQLMGYEVSIHNINNTYHLHYTKRVQRTNLNEIKKITIIDKNYSGYVYDIETEYGSFHAGVGNLIIKNTDSLYLTSPNHYFRDCDNKYIAREYTKEEYFTAMVKITLRVIAKFETEINEFLEKDNGSKFLKMENEGCNYPCVFLGKKKYFGIQHLNEVNFNPKKLYIKGIEVIKQGKSNLEKVIGNSIMKQAVSLDNEKDLVSIVKDTITESLDVNKWQFEDFIQSAAWKPLKTGNITVHSFMKRMSARHSLEVKENKALLDQGLESKKYLYSPLDPGERFSFVYVKNDTLYDMRGYKRNIKASDIMEYAHVAKEFNMQIDIIYYLIHYVIGTCARFISSYDQFVPSNKDELSDKQLDDISVKNAKSYLERFINELSGLSKQAIAQRGIEGKRMYKSALQEYSNRLPNQYRTLIEPISKIAFIEDNNEIDLIFECSEKHSKYLYTKYFSNYCVDMCTALGIHSKTGNDTTTEYSRETSYNLYKYLRLKEIHRIVSIEESNVRNQLSKFPLKELTCQYKTNIMSIMDSTNSDSEYFDDSTLQEFNDLWNALVSIQLYKYKHSQLIDYLTDLKYKKNKMVKNPSRSDISKIVKEATNAIFK
jgi:DNA polymerase elongation subunit (family B)